jgi:hypothetical protein
MDEHARLMNRGSNRIRDGGDDRTTIQSTKMVDNDGNESQARWRIVAWRKGTAPSEKKIGNRGVVARGGEKNLTLVCGFVYHVMNSTCIHLRAEGSNIYLYRRGRIYKEPLEKYTNRKD